MIVNREQALAELKARGFPEPLYGIGDKEPERYFKLAESLEQVFPGATGYLPLWEQNGEAIIAYDMSKDRFVRLYYEDSNEGGEEELGRNYQQFLTRYYLELADAGLEDKIEELAALLEYKHLPALNNFLRSYEVEDIPDDDHEFEERFLSTIS